MATGTESKHRCAAHGCSRQIPLRMLMCAAHWRQVPKGLQQGVWATYQEGQEHWLDAGERPRPTPAYMEARRAAIDAVALKDKSPPLFGDDDGRGTGV